MKFKIAILGAFDQEIDEYKKHLTAYEETRWHDYIFWTGNLFGIRSVITKSGVGKVNASLLTQKLIDTFDPQYLIFTGLAGALKPGLEIGDVVVSRDLVQHDFTAQPLFPRYAIPCSNGQDTFTFFESDRFLRERALRYSPKNHKVTEGRILTGDQFLTRTNETAHIHLTADLDGDAVEMEGAAFAQVCVINKKPFIVIRTISDKADEKASVNFSSFLPIAALNSLGVVKNILESL